MGRQQSTTHSTRRQETLWRGAANAANTLIYLQHRGWRLILEDCFREELAEWVRCSENAPFPAENRAGITRRM
jgi:hypothetical protein